jgi:hypothetical protein
MTHKEEDGSTKEHQILHSGLVEWIFHRIRMFIIAVIAFPRRAKGVMLGIGTTTANELELANTGER